jgi:signal transduction histidine kinase
MSEKGLSQRFRAWAAEMPADEEIRKVTTVPAWGAVAAFVALTFAVAAWIPWTASFLGLDPWWPMGVFGLAVAADFLTLTQTGPKRNPERLALVMLMSSTLLQLFCALLVVRSSTFGGVLFAAWLPVVACSHGYMYRSGMETPFVSIGTLVATALAMATGPSREHVAVLLVMGPASAVTAAIIGSHRLDSDKQRTEAERLRATVQTQVLWEESLRADRLAGSLEEVASWNHDMRNAVSSAMANAEVIQHMERTGTADQEELKAIAADIREALKLLLAGMEDLRAISLGSMLANAHREVVVLDAAAEAVVTGVRMRFPKVELTVEKSGPAPRVEVYGGMVAVRRLVENLAVNACEGDGTRGATRVTLALQSTPTHVVLEVRDDGPGFSRAQLDGPVATFATTKPTGTGLGLHNVQRLVMASNGTLKRLNGEAGGAVVRVELPLATDGQASSTAVHDA